MAQTRARPFDSATAQGDGSTIRVVWWSGVEPCTVLDRVEVRESPETVTVTLYEGHDPDAGRVACIELAVQKATVVRLQRPLGARRIVDGARQP